MKTAAIVLAAALACAATAAPAADRVTGKPFATRSEVYAPHAMAATSHPLATQVALDVMRQLSERLAGTLRKVENLQERVDRLEHTTAGSRDDP